MRIITNAVLFICLLIICCQALGRESDFLISESPAWIKQVNPDYETAPSNVSASSHYYLLVDRQKNIVEEENYIHFAVKILSTEGLREMSDIEIDFDPNYQKLIFHDISLIRNQTRINRLEQGSIRILQRELGMKYKQYDDELTAVINLKNVQIGDIIEYSYSIIGYNPVFGDHYADKIYLEYSIPVERLYFRLVTPRDKVLNFEYFNDAPRPEYSKTNNREYYTWDLASLPAKLYDINTPAWFDPYMHISISDFDSWEDLVNWCLDLFSVSARDDHLTKKRIKDIIGHSAIDTTIMRAIRFVQDDVRYLSFVGGLYAYKPHSPLEVLKQRYGDCKDKSFLLSEILKLYGIDASPLLVNSYAGYPIADYPPSPILFDHCIVRFEYDNRSFYIDPAVSNQGGFLKNNCPRNYYKGLTVRKGTKRLTDLPVLDDFGINITEKFDIGEIGKGARLYIKTIYSGADADYQRDLFAGSNLKSMQKSYIDFYSRSYPDIRAEKGLIMTDHRDDLNQLITEEFYIIDSIWYPADRDDQILVCNFYPLYLNEYLDIPDSPTRTMPYHINFPVNIEHETIINLPEDWTVENDSLEISGEAFIYDYSVDYFNKTIRISHNYKTLKPFISADRALAHIKSHDNIRDNLSFAVTYNKKLLGSSFEFSWLIGIITVLALGFSTYGAVLIYRKYDINVESNADTPLPIGGWLVLVGIGLFLTPFVVAYQLFTTPQYFNTNIWSALLDIDNSSKSMLLAVLMFLELIYNLAYFVYAILLFILFSKRRTIFPKLAILLMIIIPIVTILDTIATAGLGYQYLSFEDFGDILRSIIASIIWIPYLLISKRVKKTFIINLNPAQSI